MVRSMTTVLAANSMSAAVPLFRLTDEELHLLGAADAVETPYLDRLNPNERAVAVDVAYRSLLAHGVCEAQDGGLLVPDELVQLLQVRAGPTRSHRIEVCCRDERKIRHLYEAGGTTVCEDISPDGVQDFDVRPIAEAQSLLTEGLMPWVIGEAEHGRRATWHAAGDLDRRGQSLPWGSVRATADLTLYRSGQAVEVVSVIWADTGTYLISELPGLLPGAGAEWTVTGALASYLGVERAGSDGVSRWSG